MHESATALRSSGDRQIRQLSNFNIATKLELALLVMFHRLPQLASKSLR